MDSHSRDWGRIAYKLLSKERAGSEDPIFIEKILGTAGKYVIADIGCGSGYYAAALKRFASRLYCIDSSKEMLASARKRVNGKSVVFLKESSVKTSLPKSSIDIAFMANSFHDTDQKGASKEVMRILKTNGKIVVVDWKKGAVQKRVHKPKIGPPYHLRMSEADYMTWFKGFKIRKRFRAGPHHFGIIMSR